MTVHAFVLFVWKTKVENKILLLHLYFQQVALNFILYN